MTPGESEGRRTYRSSAASSGSGRPWGWSIGAALPLLPPSLYQIWSGVVGVVVDGGSHVAWDATTTPMLPLVVELCKSLLVHRYSSWGSASSARNSPTFCNRHLATSSSSTTW